MLKPRENRRLRVLIVDDYPIARRMFSTGLAGYGVDTCEAGDAAEALAVATEQSPDVVVVDLFLAGAAGYRKPIAHGPAAPGEQRRSSVDPRAARGQLGWEPRVALDEGLRRTAAWFRSR